MKMGLEDVPGVPMQVPYQWTTRGRCEVPEWIAREAYEEYAAQYGTDQSFERLHERGGFGAIELMHLLCERIDRLQGCPLRGMNGTPRPEARRG